METVEKEINIPLQEHPRQVIPKDVYVYVVTKNNLDEFLQRFEKEQNTTTFYAISVDDYKALALNIADLVRYIEQQKSIIVYYEEAIKNRTNKKEE